MEFTPMKNKYGNVWTIVTLSLFGLLILIMGVRLYQVGALNKGGRVLPFYGAVPDFKLTERSGKPLTNQDLKGKVWIADVIFTRCAGQCPMMSLKMKELNQKLPKASFASFTTDPDYDTPQVLSTYANWYEADSKRWLFLTGTKEMLNAVMAGFKMGRVDDPAMHSDRFVLVDKTGQIRGFYDANDNVSIEKLMKDIRVLN